MRICTAYSYHHSCVRRIYTVSRGCVKLPSQPPTRYPQPAGEARGGAAANLSLVSTEYRLHYYKAAIVGVDSVQLHCTIVYSNMYN